MAAPSQIFAPSGDGKLMYETFLKLQGANVIAGPVHTDGPAEFAQAGAAAHDLMQCLPELHDTVLEARGKSLGEAELLNLLESLPLDIKEQIDEWGLADTEVRELIFAHLRRQSV